MGGIMDLTMKNGRLVLNGHELTGVKEYRICIESGHKMPGTGELEIKMLVNVLENTQEQRPVKDGIDRRKGMKHLKYSELPNFIAFVLLSVLPKSKRNVYTCEKILNDALNVIKWITLKDL